VADSIKALILYSFFFVLGSLAIREAVRKKFGRVCKATDGTIIRRRKKKVICMPDNQGKNTHTQNI